VQRRGEHFPDGSPKHQQPDGLAAPQGQGQGERPIGCTIGRDDHRVSLRRAAALTGSGLKLWWQSSTCKCQEVDNPVNTVLC
jgi:hypothetical protein